MISRIFQTSVNVIRLSNVIPPRQKFHVFCPGGLGLIQRCFANFKSGGTLLKIKCAWSCTRLGVVRKKDGGR